MTFQKKMNEAMNYFQQSNIPAAKKILEKLQREHPKNSDVLGNLALIYIREGSNSKAYEMFVEAIKIERNITIVKNFIIFLNQLKKWEEIKNILKDYKEFNFTSEDKIILGVSYAISLRELGQKKDALIEFSKLFNEKPDDLNLIISYGFTLNLIGNFQDAITIYKQGLKISSDNLIINYNLGIAYSNLKLFEESNYYLEFVSKKLKNSFDVWITLAGNYANQNKVNQALEALNQCKKIDPNNILINYQLGVIFSCSGEINKSISYLQKALIQNPEHVETNYYLGVTYLEIGEYKKAIQHYRYRIKRLNNKFGMFDDFVLPKLSKDRDILIAYEQGVGDHLLYLRLIDGLRYKTKSITYISENRLKNVIKNKIPYINVISEDEFINNKDIFEKYDKINLGSIINYINDVEEILDDKKIAYIENNLAKNKVKKIGLSWKSSSERDRGTKNISLYEILDILKIKDIEFINLQYGDVEAEIDDIFCKYKIKIKYDKTIDYFNDVDALSKTIENCDEVITTSNFTVHLAGTLNKKTRLLLPKRSGKKWYWHENKNDYSIWYPSVKKYCQEKDGSWKEPIEKLRKDILTNL